MRCVVLTAAGAVLAGALCMPVATSAQTTRRPDVPSVDALSPEVAERYERVRGLEPVLEDAVARSVRRVEAQLSAFLPGFAPFTGPVRARGFVLDGYGVFFDVEYPVVRRSLLWSMEMLRPVDDGMAEVVAGLRRQWERMPEGPGQVAFGRMIEDLEARSQASDRGRAVAVGTGPTASGPDGSADAVARGRRFDPSEAYREALVGELSTAIVAVGRSLALTGGQWLTIAARDGRGRLHPGLVGVGETLELRISGSDLEALRNGRLTTDDLTQRVERRATP